MENTEQLHELAKQSIVNVSKRYGVMNAQRILTDFGITKLADASNDRVKLAAVLFMSEATAAQLGKPEDYIDGKLPSEVEFSGYSIRAVGKMMIRVLNNRGVYLPNPTTRKLAARVTETKQAASLIDLAHTEPEERTRLMIQVEELSNKLRLQSKEFDKAKAEIVRLKDELEEQELEARPVNRQIAQMMPPGPLTAGELNAKVGYESLRKILQDALNQAMNGKGHERHSNGLSFEEQPMQAICDILGSPEGMVYQVMKKLKEALGLPDADHQYHEVLGAVNYAAGVALWMQRHRQEEPDNL